MEKNKFERNSLLIDAEKTKTLALVIIRVFTNAKTLYAREILTMSCIPLINVKLIQNEKTKYKKY